MMHKHGEKVALVVALTAVAACADSAKRIAGPETSSADIRTAIAESPASAERAALSNIARLVAVALDNEPARQHLKRDMRAAPFREHKLALGTYLRSKDGSALLKAIVSASGGSEESLFATLAAIRPLEFYMPVRAHREKWTGRDPVLVVSQLDETEPIVGFDDAGRSVSVDTKGAPQQPTLSIVPVETNFSAPMNPLRSKNVRDEGGAAIGTLEPASLGVSSSMVAIAPEDGGGSSGGGGGTVSIPPGLYLEFSRILDMKEPWTRGDAEVEVHIHGPGSTPAALTQDDLSCSGEHAKDYQKVFDQDTGFWQGRVLLYSAAEVADYNTRHTEPFLIIFWEDDNDSCVIKKDGNSLMSFVQSTATALSTVAIKVLPRANPVLVGAVFVGTLFSNAGAWLLTDDDFIGLAVLQPNALYNYPDNSHVIMDGKNLNGRATIVYRQ